MKQLSKKIKHIIFLVLVIVSNSCTKNNDYHISGKVIKATTGEPIEGVQVEIYHPVSDFGGSHWHEDSHFATTNSNGDFEMVFMSKETQMEDKFTKEYLHLFSTSRTDFMITPATTSLNISMKSQTEEFNIEFEPSLPNVQEVTLGLEWNRFPGGSAENVIWGTFPSYFVIEDHIIDDVGNYTNGDNIHSIRVGEQWLKMNFDMLLEDGSRLQKTDSIWLPGRYYDITDFDFDDPRRHPVYKFKY